MVQSRFTIFFLQYGNYFSFDNLCYKIQYFQTLPENCQYLFYLITGQWLEYSWWNPMNGSHIKNKFFGRVNAILQMNRPNNLSLVCLYLTLYISFLLFGHLFFVFLVFWTHCVKKKCPNNKKEIYNDKYRHTRDRLFGLANELISHLVT